MPRFDTNMQTINLPGGGNFQFSAVRPEKLGATEYTLVTIVVDISASVNFYRKGLLNCVKSIVAACQKSSRVDNLMIRLLSFSEKREEIHGFVPLNQLDPEQYKNFICQGATALYDATYDAIAATNVYATTLFEQDFDVNAAIYIITDGEDNRSTMVPSEIADQIEKAMREEHLNSLITILVGMNLQSPSSSSYLQLFKEQARLTQFIDVAEATPDNLAKLSAFVSKSINVQSQALSSGLTPEELIF